MRIDLSKRELELLLVLVSNALAEDADDLALNGIDPRQFDLVDKLENALRYSVASISSAICSSRPRSTASVTGSKTFSDTMGCTPVALFEQCQQTASLHHVH